AGQATEIYAIEVDATETGTNVYLRTDGPVRDYKYNSIAAGSGRPDRIYVDLKNVADRGDLAPLTHVGTVLEKIRVSQRSGGIRIVLDSGLDELFEYNISEQPDGLLITIEEPAVVEEIIAGVIAGLAPEEEKPVPSVINTKKKKKVKLTEPLQEEFGETGYSNKRFSVNFYKIDLHNVFRIIGEFTGKNIVVAEDVGGFLTLQLDDVPWDFALDIIMNLKGLQKNEQFNTIVISKSGAFVWPKMITEYLSFKKYMPEQEIDPDVIEGMHEQKEARDMISRARAMIENKTFAQALPLLEAAYERWPENAQLANQIASLCLVNLGMNLKAVHYAKFALAMDSEDSNAALMAAIASANMEKADEAKDFFSMAVASDEPSREALTSYAAFLEINEDFGQALNLLERYEELFGDTMDTIVARARIYDKTGKADKAVAEYRTALLSGYEIPTDLKRYIQERVAVAKQK
ncbi:MAG: AMIN domain-containing protein, partial [Desulfobulbaceae bacterium]|nr:AMIN domain-containing protein [Desulfobulbaceae bacterium]